MAVTQTMTFTATPPILGVDTRTVFVEKAEACWAELKDNVVPDLNLAFEQINSTETNINNKEATATAAASTATTKAQLASDYAQKVNATVETGTYSSKEHAIGDLTATGGSAKAWATDTASPDGTTSKSAKTLAAEAAQSAIEAAAAAATLPPGIINDATITLVDTWSSSKINTELGGKQATLVSGTNIKSINGNSILGSGDLTIEGFTLAQAQAAALCF